MKITKTLYITNGREWRAWLQKHHNKEKEIWLVYYRKNSGKPRIPYNEAIEEALCFGWIDSLVKNIDKDSLAHRWTPRKKGSSVSDMNKERIRRLIKAGRMTKAGLDTISHEMKKGKLPSKLFVPADIREALAKNMDAWKNFQKFPLSYRRIRIGWIEGARKRPVIFNKRLHYFIKKTAQNKKFGMIT